MSWKIKRYVVTAVDCGDSCDGHPSCLGVFNTEDDAKNYVKNDIEDRCDQLAGCDIRADFDRMEILDFCDQPICQWSIDTVDVELTNDEEIEIGAHRYVEGIQHGIDMAKEEK